MFVGAGKKYRSDFFPLEIPWRRGDHHVGQVLLQGGEAAGVGAQSNKLNVFIRVNALLCKNHAGQHMGRITEASQANSFTGKLFDGFDFGTGEENVGGTAH